MNFKTTLCIALICLLGAPKILHAQEINQNSNLAMTFTCEKEQVDYTISTKGSNVNLRSGPGINHSIIAKIPNNSVLTKISDFSNGRWAKTVFVASGGREYIGYILYDESYTKPAPKTNSTIGDITGNRVVFRKGDSILSGKLGYFYKGNTVEVLELARNNYYKIRVVNTNNQFKDNIGYVYKDYVQISN